MKKIEQVPDIDTLDDSFVKDILLDPERMKLVNRFNKEYYHWDELRYRVDDEMRDSFWIVMKLLRGSNSKQIHVCGLDVSYMLLPEFQEYLFHIDRDSAGLISIDNPNKKDIRRYVTSSLMEEAIASSQMEGAATTRKEAKRMLRSQRRPRNVDERMIVNNYEAMEHIKKTVSEDLSIPVILEMHRTITKGTLYEGPEWEGRFREDDDTVVASPDREDVIFHVPPKHDSIPALMQELCDFVNKDGDEFIHPILKGIMIHYLIGYIHPFVNGNGRLARSLYYWYVIKKGYWLMEFTSISRIMKNSQTRYGLAYQYTETDGYDLTYFMKFNLNCIEKGVDDLRKYIDKKAKEQRRTIEAIESSAGLNLYEVTIVKDYIKDGAPFSIKEISVRYSISYQTARNYVRDLCEKGYVRPVSKDRKTVLYTVTDNGIR